MRCPECTADEVAVTNSRPTLDEMSVRRRRLCRSCGHRFSTVEVEILTFATADTADNLGGEAQALSRGRQMVEAFAFLTEADAKKVMWLVRRLAGADESAAAEDVAA